MNYYHRQNANGYSAELVIVLADDSMDEESIEVFPIDGFGDTNAKDGVGYWVFTKTRFGNKQFFHWYATNIVIPFIGKGRKLNKCKVWM